MYSHIALYYVHLIAAMRAEGKPVPHEIKIKGLGALLVSSLDPQRVAAVVSRGAAGT